jgi:DNA-binding MarR family transcriptional regulator
LQDTSRGQGRILAMLRLKSKITAKDLSYILGIRQHSLNETLQKLEKEGYIVRTPSPKDRRIMLISLTEKGNEIKPVQHDCLDVLDEFSDEGLKQFASYIDRLRKACDQQIKTIASPEDEARFDEFNERMLNMRNKMGSEDFQKMMRHSREIPFGDLFYHPFD